MQSRRRTLEASIAPLVTTQAAMRGKESGGRMDATTTMRTGRGSAGGEDGDDSGARVRQHEEEGQLSAQPSLRHR
jgi:hypothetical protein